MKFSVQELNLINFSLKFEPSASSPNGFRSKSIPESLLTLAVSILDKLEAIKPVENAESEVEFTDAEKKMILDFITHDWGVEDGRYYLKLKTKLAEVAPVAPVVPAAPTVPVPENK